ncbi:YheC/YheD family protein [Paenibacillus tritici]|uniref:YheC/YheD family protein n=1 Tax=Paenibacillus tritici TaxID=1873425 RepID=A0ABX2DMA0_9BACL|nr:YheC/YheD family protein [Paenibacillus tritici]NQX45747.1 YheC/YheD family protein [Paenibacillus tritici]QUL54006.1 YheC/YheD family protein [Paenibacillus tritici]
MGQKLVGILLNAAMHGGVPRLKTGQESLANYEEAAAAYGLTPCFLKLSDIDTQSGFSSVYMKTNSQGYRRHIIPTPEVIHNRAIYDQRSSGVERLLRQGIHVYNTCNRYGKDQIHGLLEQNRELQAVLPVTSAGISGLKEMMGSYTDLILKPCRGSVGNGVMRLTRSGGERWIWSYSLTGSKRSIRTPVNPGALPRALRARLSSVPYLVQERIPLAEINGRPFDLRVTVQRGWGGAWQVTGMFAKLAAPGGFVSNIARGGEALKASSALEKAFSGEEAARIRMSVLSLSLSIARELEQSLPGLADIGLDIGVTKHGHLFFIECNGRDQRYGFRKAGLSGVWKDSYRQPMGYARYLHEAAIRINSY